MKEGVLLVQLGGPERREDLEPFLYALFADPEVLSIPIAPLRKAAAWTLAKLRAPKSAETYERIGWSPIRRWTEKQARLLGEELALRRRPAAVRAGMTCSKPSVEEALAELRAKGVDRLHVVPLYPQYSVTTTKSSFDRVGRALVSMRWSPARADAPDSWFDEPEFVTAHVARIEEALRSFPEPERVVLLYSAHSLPVSTVKKRKDPYPGHVEGTMRAVDAALGNRFASRLGYQSKVGPVAWLGPSTSEVLAELAREGASQVLAVPIAFVSDHVETLYEIRMLFADEARALGIGCFAAAEGLNDHPAFIRALANLVGRAAAPHA